MTQELFDMCVVTASKIHLRSAVPLDEISAKISSMYSGDYVDAHCEDEIVDASVKLIEWLMEGHDDFEILLILDQFEFLLRHYHHNGKKKRKILKGTWFNKEKNPIPNKVYNSERGFLIYYTGTYVSGMFPMLSY